MSDIRITFAIERRNDDGEFVEIGFGDSGPWSTVDQAAHMLQSAVTNREWETTDGQPDPGEVP